jgi:hypothetical protein
MEREHVRMLEKLKNSYFLEDKFLEMPAFEFIKRNHFDGDYLF